MLSARQRSRLAGLAQSRDCLAILGRAGASEGFAARLDLLLARHELVKMRFGDFKEGRQELAAALAARCGAELVRVIGNVAVFFRRSPDPEKRKIELD